MLYRSNATAVEFPLDVTIVPSVSPSSEEEQPLRSRVGRGVQGQRSRRRCGLRKSRGRIQGNTHPRGQYNSGGGSGITCRQSISQSHVNTLENPDTSALTVHPFNPLCEPGSYVASYDEPFTPLDFFKLFFTEDIIKQICKNSDKYAERNKDRSPYN